MRLQPNITPIPTSTTDTYIDGLILRNGNPLMWQFDGGYVSLNSSATPTSWNYYISDHFGSTKKVVTGTNAIKETINYYPYGSEMRLTDQRRYYTFTNPGSTESKCKGDEIWTNKSHNDFSDYK